MANKDFSILRHEENGIEYFTVAETGESGMSLRGLDRACQKPNRWAGRIIKSLEHLKSVEGLEHWRGKTLTLEQSITRNGKLIKCIKADLCSDIIFEEACKGNKAAKVICQQFHRIGLTSFIQTKTGWLPEQYTASPQSHEQINRILDQPNPYEALYSKEMCERAFSWFGCQFYWDYFYCWMTDEECCKLNEANPPIGGKRESYIHQWIEVETRERLRDKAIELGGFIKASRSREQFIELFNNCYGDGWQLGLF